MLFAKAIVALTSAAVVMAACRQDRFGSRWGLSRGRMYDNMMMDGLRCKCDNTGVHDDEVWTNNECSALGKEVKWCYGAAEFYCETGDRGDEFRKHCASRGSTCYADDC
ncbi:hypothetical protein BC939DRAFT_475936 [Gamsiella multidivaricata]|uniref:uncharacterized protein n=1 Tax=Gamsiella multidivaricata TaxID=101098 RepID=UPI0022203305|nr:uncharacterized protein BC939DRAFT_475936 [Gamsiella multidivaricata]KAI7825978.1 hypothetical protein BC939DRAFT_475936 [Gamsiella multidivaricata]